MLWRSAATVLGDIAEGDPRYGARRVIGEPDCPVADAERVATRAPPLAQQRQCIGVDDRQGHLGKGGPDPARREGDVAAGSGRAERQRTWGHMARKINS